jgi:poly-gamma-glutamate synthesis protein (capsule biosynthesis protein)
MIKLFLAGDVMTGRGIDQILPHPCEPQIYENNLRSALEYVALAERASGTMRRPVRYDYIWGEALGELSRRKPHVRIVNLETAVTAAPQMSNEIGITITRRAVSPALRSEPRGLRLPSKASIACRRATP